MSLTPPAVDSTEYKIVPMGAHKAVLTQIIDLGMQPGFEGGPEKPQVFMRWTTDQRMPDSEFNYSLGQYYTLSLHEKSNLRKMLVQWRGRQFTPEEIGKFDLSTLIGKSCTLMITHVPKQNGEMRANLAGISPLKESVAQPDACVVYNQDSPDAQEVYANLPEYLRNKINVKASTASTVPLPEDFNDDIPF